MQSSTWILFVVLVYFCGSTIGVVIGRTCRSSSECDDSTFCLFEPSLCRNGMGTCTHVPTSCAEDQDPVCGCDLQTYNNPCHAAQSNVSILVNMPCEHLDFCYSNDQCGDDGFCRMLNHTCRGPGVCTYIPRCTLELIIDPVCGCDGQTYFTPCIAGKNRVSVASAGACKGFSSRFCSSDSDCGSGLRCHFAPGSCSPPGECLPIPELCTAESSPVCGCDSITYDNACRAAVSKANVRSEGACTVGVLADKL